jgi:hypothetical protein
MAIKVEMEEKIKLKLSKQPKSDSPDKAKKI